METVVVLFTRDLRVHDHPALAAACADADRVVPLFVFDDAVFGRRIASPNKTAFLLDCVADLTSTMRDLGGALCKRRGVAATWSTRSPTSSRPPVPPRSTSAAPLPATHGSGWTGSPTRSTSTS